MAVMWYFENMDNPGNIKRLIIFLVLQTPLRVKKGGAPSKKEDSVPQDLVDNLVAMLGFPEKKVRKALKNTVSKCIIIEVGQQP